MDQIEEIPESSEGKKQQIPHGATLWTLQSPGMYKRNQILKRVSVLGAEPSSKPPASHSVLNRGSRNCPDEK